MRDIELPQNCLIADGPAGLTQTLDDLLAKSQADAEFASQAHYVLYQLGHQRALIKIDMSKRPYLFWYGDLLGRPATQAVKNTIARFLYEKCGETDIQFVEDDVEQEG